MPTAVVDTIIISTLLITFVILTVSIVPCIINSERMDDYCNYLRLQFSVCIKVLWDATVNSQKCCRVFQILECNAEIFEITWKPSKLLACPY